eukprot:scaffold22676_cov60-Phaeocystis_antarctica.AAC.6
MELYSPGSRTRATRPPPSGRVFSAYFKVEVQPSERCQSSVICLLAPRLLCPALWNEVGDVPCTLITADQCDHTDRTHCKRSTWPLPRCGKGTPAWKTRLSTPEHCTLPQTDRSAWPPP